MLNGQETFQVVAAALNGSPSGASEQTTTGQVAALGGNSTIGIGIFAKKLAALNSNTIYSAGTTAYTSGVYTTSSGAQPLPATLMAGQIFAVDFNQTNTASANLIVGILPEAAIAIEDVYGNILSLIGGEIVTGWNWLRYNGSRYILLGPSPTNIPVTATLAVTQLDFASGNIFYLAGGNETLNLPATTELSPNGAIYVFSVNGTATLSVTSSGDEITKNGATATSTTLAQGAALAAVVTNGNGNFYVSGS
jgi:hypothetical protein